MLTTASPSWLARCDQCEISSFYMPTMQCPNMQILVSWSLISNHTDLCLVNCHWLLMGCCLGEYVRLNTIWRSHLHAHGSWHALHTRLSNPMGPSSGLTCGSSCKWWAFVHLYRGMENSTSTSQSMGTAQQAQGHIAQSDWAPQSIPRSKIDNKSCHIDICIMWVEARRKEDATLRAAWQ